VIHAEALVGDRRFWLTRPYEWKKLLGAKALFLLVFLYRVLASRLLLIALPIVVILSGLAIPESTAISHAYPRPTAAQEAPVQLTLLRDTPHPATSDLIRANQVQVSIPLQVSGVAEGYAFISDALQVTVDAANGSHWSSPWQGAYNLYYLPGTSESGVNFPMSRAFFDQVRSMPVTLRFTLALTQVRAGDAKSIPMSTQDFSVPDFGICSPDPHLMERQFFGISCKFALRQPRLTYVRVRWQDSSCAAPQPDPDTGVEGGAWNGTLDNTPADFGITSVWSAPIGFSNPTNVEGNKVEPRHLCPGTPVIFTQYNFVRRLQYNFAIPDFRFPDYHPEGGPVGGLDIGIMAK
jgi:hypothetical protein